VRDAKRDGDTARGEDAKPSRNPHAEHETTFDSGIGTAKEWHEWSPLLKDN
jgi:hypothetical protein